MSVPTNAIALWTGTIAGIPANWNLCNGGGTTPDLRDRFVRGAPAATEAGTTGGASTHTHTQQATGSHTHTTDTAGAHQHTTVSGGGHVHANYAYASSGSGLNTSNQTTGGAHTHTVNSFGGHAHQTDSQGSHTHTLSDTAEGRPPWYDVLYIQAAAGASVATNIRAIWSGAVGTIPANWSEDTNLREKFIRGASNGVDAGGTGGSTDHVHATQNSVGHTHDSTDSVGNHTHTFNNDTVAHNHGSQSTASGTRTVQTAASYNWQHQHGQSDSIGAHTHTFQSGGIHNDHGNVGTLDSNKSMPLYKQAFFMKNDGAAAFSVGTILIWVGTLATIPATWNLCDGGGSRPDYRGYFLRGVPNGGNVGDTGGANTHIHTDNPGGVHSDHAQNAFATAHQHAATDSVGNHTHGTVSGTRTTGATMNTDSSTGAHTHTYTNDAWNHTHTTQANGSTHTHTIDSGSTLPPYYEVQFIYYSGASGQPYISRVQGVGGMNTWNRSINN